MGCHLRRGRRHRYPGANPHRSWLSDSATHARSIPNNAVLYSSAAATSRWTESLSGASSDQRQSGVVIDRLGHVRREGERLAGMGRKTEARIEVGWRKRERKNVFPAVGVACHDDACPLFIATLNRAANPYGALQQRRPPRQGVPARGD
jgi:hypothetical protein